jgi:diguanylate cyclase
MRNDLTFGVETKQSEYRRIDEKWLRIQYLLLLWLAAFTPVAEVFVFLLMSRLGSTNSSPSMFLLKYVLVPFLYNGAIVLIATLFIRGRLSERRKIYGISLLTAAMAFGVYTFHSTFPALYVIFAIPMVVTVIYGDRHLTTIIGALCLVGKAVSDLFLFWDPARISVLTSPSTFTNFCISMLLIVLFYVVCWLLLRTEQAKNNVSLNLEQERLRYQKRSMTDALTQVGNRLALASAFQSMEEQQHQCTFYLAMMDLDAFKQLNDTFGHNQGDQYLRTLGLVLLNSPASRSSHSASAGMSSAFSFPASI